MRKLNELIVLVRGGGEVGSAIAHRLFCSHFRVCITEIAQPLAINRGTCFSEAVFDASKTVEGITAERTLPSLEHIYQVWREGKIPIVVDSECTSKALICPDVLVNAIMLKRITRTKITDAPLVIGIGPGFTANLDVHAVIETANSNLGKVLFEGRCEEDFEQPTTAEAKLQDVIITASDVGVFTTEKNICDSVTAGEIIGNLGNVPLKAPVAGILRGLLRNETKVLSGSKLFEIDPVNSGAACFSIRNQMRSLSGGVLQAIMQALNVEEMVN